MSDLTPITRGEALLDGQDLEPITRKEQFIKRIYDKTQEVPTPITREEWFLKKAGEGTSPVTIEQLNVTENGTYSEEGKAYSPVIVEVPEPTLITKSITANGTYSASDDNADGYSQVTVAVEGFKKKSIIITPTDIASFNDGTANPMPSLEISIEPVQSGSGDPSPSNVRPISGWSGAKIADDAEYGGFINWNNKFIARPRTHSSGVTITRDGEGYAILNGTASSSDDNANVGTIDADDGHKFFIIGGSANQPASFQIGSGVFRNILNGIIYNGTGVGRALTTPIISGTTYEGVEVKCICTDLTQLFGSTIADYIYQLEQTTAGAGVAYFRNLFPKDYYPYNAGEITTVSAVNGDVDKYSITSIPFHDSSDNPITVYGGTLNVTSGELTVTHGTDTVNENTSIVRNDSFDDFIRWTVNENDVVEVTNQDTRKRVIANNLKSAAGVSALINVISVISNKRIAMNISTDIATDITTLKNWLANNNVQFVYELATPQTYQLTPAQVTTLLGQNNIFADCGQILEGEYFVTL